MVHVTLSPLVLPVPVPTTAPSPPPVDCLNLATVKDDMGSMYGWTGEAGETEAGGGEGAGSGVDPATDSKLEG